MRIHKDMNLDDLQERMGDATLGQATEMRALLNEEFEGQETGDIDSEDWDELLKRIS